MQIYIHVAHYSTLLSVWGRFFLTSCFTMLPWKKNSHFLYTNNAWHFIFFQNKLIPTFALVVFGTAATVCSFLLVMPVLVCFIVLSSFCSLQIFRRCKVVHVSPRNDKISGGPMAISPNFIIYNNWMSDQEMKHTFHRNWSTYTWWVVNIHTRTVWR